MKKASIVLFCFLSQSIFAQSKKALKTEHDILIKINAYSDSIENKMSLSIIKDSIVHYDQSYSTIVHDLSESLNSNIDLLYFNMEKLDSSLSKSEYSKKNIRDNFKSINRIYSEIINSNILYRQCCDTLLIYDYNLKNELREAKHINYDLNNEINILLDSITTMKAKYNNLIENNNSSEVKSKRRLEKCKEDSIKSQKLIVKLKQELEGERLKKQNAIESLKREKLKKQNEFEGKVNSWRRSIDNKYYSLSPIPEREIVKGKTGIYFNVELKNPILDKTLFFELEKYTIQYMEENYRKSIDTFYNEVIEVLEKTNKDYELFIKGSADIDNFPFFSKKQHDRYSYNKVTFLKRDNNNDQYEFNSNIETIPNTYKNDHLPNLRAMYIKDVLTDHPFSFDSEKVHILEGNIKPIVDKRNRNVQIILFLER